ncbi:MAG TPA: hypothetical protein VHM90_10825 [Phycisphaerae bacterium]|nr:hypothetical protein [Phycisphaerae bacterium]
MVRRWIIRVPFLLALACVLSVWAVSYFGALAVFKESPGDRRYIGAVQGLCDIGEIHPALEPLAPQSLFYPGSNAKAWGIPPTTLGFFWGDPFPYYFEIVFPLWLPAVVLAGLNWFVWRKTRAKGVGRAFPVEAASEGAAGSSR